VPSGLKGEKRPADVSSRTEDGTTDDGKNAAAVILGRMGGKARAKGMSAKRRREIARKAAQSRWKT
jgi:hypothetical protein